MPTPSVHHQTIAFLQRRLGEAGIHVKPRWGQNFLIDLNLQRLLVEAAEIGRQDVVLEVGAGTGALTVLLAERAGSVVSFEIDAQMYQLASESIEGLTNVQLIQGDALSGKHRLAPELLEGIERQLAACQGSCFKVVANLPYGIATPLIATLLAQDRPPTSLTVTIQKELADRITARPATKDYSALSVWLQSQCDVELVRGLPPTVFWPRPQVNSAIVQLKYDPAKRAQIVDREFFHTFVRSLFCHRRKLLRGQLLIACDKQLDAPVIARILTTMQLPAEARAEQLSVAQLVALSAEVQRWLACR